MQTYEDPHLTCQHYHKPGSCAYAENDAILGQVNGLRDMIIWLSSKNIGVKQVKVSASITIEIDCAPFDWKEEEKEGWATCEKHGVKLVWRI